MKKIILLPLAASITSFAAMPAINLLGFAPNAEKQVVIPGNDASPLEVIDLKTGKPVLKLKAPYVGEWDASGEETQVFDFSSIKKTGTYRLRRSNEFLGTPFEIQESPYIDLTKSALKWFYYQRASLNLEAKYAGKWARAKGHPDYKAKVYGEKRTIDSPKGWYDAGDYGKYIVNSGITVFTLFELYEHFPKTFDSLSWNIPIEHSKYPDLLEEIRWNLDWMLSMQDKDGGVFHKLSSLKFCGSIMPEQDLAERFAIGKNTVATLDFAAVMAQAAYVYKNVDAAYAKKMLSAAEKAYAWAKANPKIIYKQPSDVETGSYVHKSEDALDEFRFAAAELYRTTGKKEYFDELKQNPFNPNGPWWGDVNFLGIYRIALDKKTFGDSLSNAAQKILLNEADNLTKEGDTSAYRLPMHPWNWNWGSNSAVANNGIILLHAYYLTGKRDYLDGAQQTLDYLLGKNPFQLSYVTGFGVRSPKNPHHRPSEADYVDDPVPGMLVGGPHLGKQDIGPENWKCDDYAQANKPALAYADERCSYATNEVAINWNAPLAYLAGALHSIYNGYGYLNGKGLK